MTTRLPNPVAQWAEAPTSQVALPIALRYIAYDAGTTTYTITADRTLAAAELVDVTSSGVFTLTLLGVVASSAPRQKIVALNGTILHVY